MLDYTPKPYQSRAIRFLLDNPRCALFMRMGGGKTSSVLTAFEYLRLAGEETRPMLVLAPVRVARSVWPTEVEKWNHLKHLRVVSVLGSAAERRAALRQKADIFTINYENIPWLVDTLGDEWPFGVVVADESTKLKSFRTRQGGKRARSLAVAARGKTSRWINLTGTPSPNGLKDLWGQTWFLDAGERLGRTYSSFISRWFTPTWNGFGVEPLPHAQREIEEKLADICLSVNLEEYFGSDKPVTVPVEVDLPPPAVKIYKDMAKKMFAELKETDITAVNAAARSIKCLQIANGAAYTDSDGVWEELHSAKLDALEDIIEESAGAPVIVVYNFKSDLARLQARFKQGRTLDTKAQTVNEWNKGEIPLLFLHPASAGHGLNLAEGGNIMVFFALDWNLENHLQVIERIGPVRQKQAGKDRAVMLYYILAKNTIDSAVMKRLTEKKSVQDSFLEAMLQFKKGT